MQNAKFYGLAFAIILIAELVTTGLQVLGAYYPTGHPVAILAANLSGVTLGGIIMVIGFLRDNRLEQERKRTEAAETLVKEERKRAEAAETLAKEERERTEAAETLAKEERKRANQERERANQERERADREQERADRLMSELLARQERDDAMEARIRSIEEQLNDNATLDAAPDAAPE